MAKVLILPLDHPARRPNPFGLPVKKQTTLNCPYGCNGSFENQGMLYLHLLCHESEERAAQAKQNS